MSQIKSRFSKYIKNCFIIKGENIKILWVKPQIYNFIKIYLWYLNMRKVLNFTHTKRNANEMYCVIRVLSYLTEKNEKKPNDLLCWWGGGKAGRHRSLVAVQNRPVQWGGVWQCLTKLHTHALWHRNPTSRNVPKDALPQTNTQVIHASSYTYNSNM